MADDYRVPVQKQQVAIHGQGIGRTEVLLFLPQGMGIETFFESSDSFFAASESNTFRLYNRRVISCVEVQKPSTKPVEMEDGLPEKESRVLVRMVDGTEHRGVMRFVVYEGVTRPVDILNHAPLFFAIHDGTVVKYLAKAHVQYVQEERT